MAFFDYMMSNSITGNSTGTHHLGKIEAQQCWICAPSTRAGSGCLPVAISALKR
jgi:hypothetical protein